MPRSNLERALDWLRSRYETSPDVIFPLASRVYSADGTVEDVPPEPIVLVLRQEFDDFLLSIDAPRQETILECRRRGWITAKSMPSRKVPSDKDLRRQKYYKIHSQVMSARLDAPPSQADGDPRDPSYLGLRLDRDLRTVTRAGFDCAPIRMTPREWEMFLILHAARGEEVPRSRFKRPMYDGSTKDGALRNVKNELATKLACLNLDLSDWSIKDCRKT